MACVTDRPSRRAGGREMLAAGPFWRGPAVPRSRMDEETARRAVCGRRDARDGGRRSPWGAGAAAVGARRLPADWRRRNSSELLESCFCWCVLVCQEWTWFLLSARRLGLGCLMTGRWHYVAYPYECPQAFRLYLCSKLQVLLA